MEMARDEVRVMTVHGAKWLEANTVILADTTTPPTGPHDPQILHLASGALVWAKARKEDVGAMSEAREAARGEARDEYRRLLYVAMTRAAERLVVCGTKGTKKVPDGCWYELVNNALCDHCVGELADDGDGEVLRYRKGEALPAPALQIVDSTPPPAIALPAWLTRNATPEIAATRTVTPSSAEEDAARPAATGGGAAALKRGSLVHRLMQSLPDIPAERRAKAAEEYLSRAGADLPAEERATLAEQVLRILADANFHALYTPGSRAEVPIVGRLSIGGQIVRVSGQIDRLAVTPEAVLIADYKTNRPPPRRIADVPPAYVRQLAFYRAVLARLYPDRPVRAALIWTEVPDLMELSVEALDLALTQVNPA
jgi:ATP-dependent helicase/nuclease subunit A